MRGLPAVAAGLFRCLDEEGVEYCVLGDLRGCPSAARKRIELVIEHAARGELPVILKAYCDRAQLLLIERPPHPQRVSHYVLSWLDRTDRPQFLNVLVRSDYFRSGRRLWKAAQMLQDRRRAAQLLYGAHSVDVFSPPPAIEFARHLLRCVDSGELSERDGEHLGMQWRLDPAGAARQVARFWDVAREGGIVVRAAASGHWDAVRASLRALGAALTFHNVPAPPNFFVELQRCWRQWLRPHGMLIACLGPDGAGRAEAVRRLAERPLAIFDGAQVMQMRPQVMRPAPRTPAPRRGAWGRLGAAAKLTMFVVDYWLGYWVRIRPSLVRGNLVASNRYFDDVLVDPLRYRIQRPRAFAKMLSRWIPQPALWLVFDAPPAVLRERRAAAGQCELQQSELERLRMEYRRVLRGRRNGVVLDASQPLEQLIAQAERAIAAQAAHRTAKRLGLPQDCADNPLSARVLLFCCKRRTPVLSALVRMLFNSDIRRHMPSDIHLPHPYGITIHPQAVIGRRVTVMQQATIGGRPEAYALAPIIGDDVYIGAGARVLGDVRVADRAVIAANAVVTRDVPPGSTVVGVNRLVAGRVSLTARRSADGSVAQFPVSAQRGAHR